ncbi:MAG: VanZ family protein [Methylococcaceae bacterium]|nr:VanZ family protein [Methylococcaceae bacterium]
MHKRLNILALISYCGLIYWLSDQTGLPTPELFENQDKLQHFLAYFVMGILAWRAIAHLPWRREWTLLASFGFCCIYGLSDEWHQSFVVGRDASALDWMADSIGGLVAAISCYWHASRIRQPAAEQSSA